MNAAEHNRKPAAVTDVSGPSDELLTSLLEGKLVAYHDANYGVTSGEHQILFRLLRDAPSRYTLFYLHIPYAYPLPDGIKDHLTQTITERLQLPIHLTCVNAGAEIQKHEQGLFSDVGDR